MKFTLTQLNLPEHKKSKFRLNTKLQPITHEPRTSSHPKLAAKATAEAATSSSSDHRSVATLSSFSAVGLLLVATEHTAMQFLGHTH